MRTLTKFFVALSLTVAGLCYTPKPAKADMFGAVDASLLFQQILQYVQDGIIGGKSERSFIELVNDVKNKATQVKKIINIFNNGQQGIATFNNVVNCVRSTSRALEYMDSYMSYIGTIGDDFELDRCYYIYRQFNRKTNAVLDMLKRSIQDMQNVANTGETEGPGLLKLMDETISKASATLNTISNECISDLGEVIHENKMRKQAAAVRKTVNTVII